MSTDPIAHAAVRGFRESAKTRLAAVLGRYRGLTIPVFADGVTVSFLDEETLLIGRHGTDAVRGVSVADGSETMVFGSSSPRLRALDVLRDGALALVSAWDSRLRLFDARNGEQALVWENLSVIDVGFVDGARFVTLTGSAVDGGKVELRGLPDGSVVRTFDSPPAFAVTASSDAVALVAGPNTRRVVNAYALDGTRLFARTLDTALARAPRFALAFSPDGTRLALAAWNLDRGAPVVEILDAATGALLRTLDEPGVSGIAWLPDGSALALAGHYRAALWDPTTGVRRWEIRTEACRSVAVSPSGRTLAFGVERGGVQLVDAGSGALRVVAEAPEFSVPFSLEADGRTFRANVGRDEVRVSREGEILERVAPPAANAPAALLSRLSPDGRRLAVAERNEVAILDAASKRPLFRLRDGHAAGIDSYDLNDDLHVTDRYTVPVTITAIAFSPDGARILTVASDGGVCLWDGRSGARLQSWEGGRGALPAFDQSGAAAYFGGNRIVCVDARDGASRFELPIATRCFAVASDRPLLAAGTTAREIVLLHAADGRELDRLSMTSAADLPNTLAFSGDELWCLTHRGVVLRFALT